MKITINIKDKNAKYVADGTDAGITAMFQKEVDSIIINKRAEEKASVARIAELSVASSDL